MMDFISSMKEVWMAVERRKCEEDAWKRKVETLHWELQNAGGQQPSGDRTQKQSGSQGSGAFASLGNECDSELNRVLDRMNEDFGSLAASDGEDLQTRSTTMVSPPHYHAHQNFQTVSSNSLAPAPPPPSSSLSSDTQLKQLVSTESSGNGDTPVKCTEVGTEEPMTSKQKDELLGLIQKLTEEQQALKAKMTEHDKSLNSLIAKQPSVRRRISKSVAQMMFVPPFPTGQNKKVAEYQNLGVTEDERIYVQIEQLYANLCCINFPFQQKVPTKCVTQRENIYSSPSSCEAFLLMENKKLQDKIAILEKRLEEKSPALEDINNHNIEQLKYPGESVDTADPESEQSADENVIHRPVPVLKRDVRQIEAMFEWTVSNYFQKLELEKLRKLTHTASEPFYIEPCGYLATLETFLNGNGTGCENGSMSVFLRIIKGEYDTLLNWPAMLSLTFILVNQDNKRTGSLIYAEDKIFQFKKPSGTTYDESDSWGLIEFVPHQTINSKSYIKNGTIKLRIKIFKHS